MTVKVEIEQVKAYEFKVTARKLTCTVKKYLVCQRVSFLILFLKCYFFPHCFNEDNM